MSKRLPPKLTGFTLIEVITSLIVISFAGLIAATVLGAGYLRVEQMVTQQEDLRRTANCVENIKARMEGQSASYVDGHLDELRTVCGTDISITVQNARASVDTDKAKTVKLEVCTAEMGNLCALRLITVKGAMEFNYVVGHR